MRSRPRVLSVLATCLFAVAALAGSAGAAAPVPGQTGHDVSSPQCGGALPTTGSFGIVGVNAGRAYTANSCLGAELSWAGGLSSSPSLYTNPANPAPTSSYYWPATGSSDPVLCLDSTSTTDPGCAYDYGWHAAANALATATAATTAAASLTWWLDVETGNTYNGNGSSNAADLQGMIDYLRGHGVPSVGLYSTGAQWTTITGGWTLSNDASYRSGWSREFVPAYPLSDSPVWIAGLSSLSTAQSNCSTSFTGVAAQVAQYTDGSFDGDLVCGSSATPGATVPSAPLNASASPDTSKGIAVSWTAPASSGGAALTSYVLNRGTRTGGESPYATISCSSSCPTSFADTRARSGRLYYYTVRAANSVGTGPVSNETSAVAR